VTSPNSGRREGAGTERGTPGLAEGWYLLSTQELERILRWWRDSPSEECPLAAEQLTVEDALAYRDGGNVPDERDRSLRLLLFARDRNELLNLSSKRARFEPDFHDAPSWRREGSRPVNVVPLRRDVEAADARPWWDDPELAAMESEWAGTGAIEGLCIPETYRGFVYKTILSLRAGGRAVTVESVADSVARWLAPEEAAEIRAALQRANASRPPIQA
jgi:hypothetical protein